MPQATSALYLSSKKAATDPRFVKLAPVFRCSNLKCGDTRRSVDFFHVASFCLFTVMRTNLSFYILTICLYWVSPDMVFIYFCTVFR